MQERQSHQDAMARLQRSGVEIDCFEDLKLSLLAIDDHIVWHAISPLLAQPTDDPSLRLVSSQLARTLGHLVLPNRSETKGSAWMSEFPSCPTCTVREVAHVTRDNEVYFTCPNGHARRRRPWQAPAKQRGRA